MERETGLEPATTCLEDEMSVFPSLTLSLLPEPKADAFLGRSGAIINISSLSALRPRGFTAYSAVKGGVISLTRAMAETHARDNVRVNCIIPGAVFTPMVAESITNEIRERRILATPLQTEGTAWDVAWAAVYLASDEARWITGIGLPVDGGALLTRQRYW